jgi:hypothetical protein
MAFPTSPVNAQTAVVNGITYVYNASNLTWTRQANGSATLGSLTLASQLTTTAIVATGTTTTATLAVTGSGTIGASLTVSTGNVTLSSGSLNIVAGNIYSGGALVPNITTMLTYNLAF